MEHSSLSFTPLVRSGPVPEPLMALFDGPEGTALFALLDAAQVPNLPLMLAQSGLNHACLFDGVAADEFGEAAPWLVELTPDAPLAAQLFTLGQAPWTLWGKARFALIRSPAPRAALKAHFKRFVRPETLSTKRMMFRFWDAQIWSDYIEGTLDEPERAARLLSGSQGWICTQLALYHTKTPTVALYTPQGAPPPHGPFAFDAIDRQALTDGVEHRMRNDVAARLAPKFDEILPGGSGFAKDHTLGAFHLIKKNTPPGLAISAEDVFQLALLGYLWGDARGEILKGPVFSERLIPISTRIALARESYFETLKQIAQKET